MIFGQDRDELRKMYADAWRKHQNKLPLSPLEAQIVSVIERHPEYHSALQRDEIGQDYIPDGGQTNPFLHMGLHLGLREQIATDRPVGVRSIFNALSKKTGDPHESEHQMIECLAETLWEAQSENRAPNEEKYRRRLQRLVR